jgi:hypothetical protein
VFFTAIKDLDTEGGIKAFPNPNEGKLYLAFTKTITSNFDLTVHNPSGQIIKQQKLTKEALQQIDISDWAAGIYILHLKNENDIFVKKITKI